MLGYEESLKQSVKDSERIQLVVENCIRYFEGEHVKLYSNEDRHIIPGAKEMDMHGGADQICMDAEHGSIICTVASRVQRQRKNYRTFTIRESRASGTETEYAKRLNEIEKCRVYPKYTYQAYVHPETNKLLGLAVVKTKDLYLSIRDNKVPFYYSRTSFMQRGQSQFIVVDWDDIIRKDIPLVEWVESRYVLYNKVIMGGDK